VGTAHQIGCEVANGGQCPPYNYNYRRVGTAHQIGREVANGGQCPPYNYRRVGTAHQIGCEVANGGQCPPYKTDSAEKGKTEKFYFFKRLSLPA